MQDFKVEQLNDSTFDLVVENNQFVTESSFRTAFNYQLFINKRADKNLVSTPRERGGWMGDLITKPDYQSGSYIYTKHQARNTQNDKNDIAAYTKKSLEYFLDFGAKEIIVIVNDNNINGEIKVDNDTTLKYNSLWRGV